LVLTPLRLPAGAHVIVNCGFLPGENKDPASRLAGQISGRVTITGLMRPPEQRHLFTPADTPEKVFGLPATPF
jgi:surfeit locus 1 family protein